MDEPLVVAALISLIALALSAVIAGSFACIKVSRVATNGNSAPTLTTGLLLALNGQTTALTIQTKAVGDLTDLLREGRTEDRNDHKQMISALTVLVERSRGCSEQEAVATDARRKSR